MPIKLTGKLSDITPEYLKERYLTDLTLKLADGSDWPTIQYEHAINVSVQKFQDLTQVNVVSTPIVREQHDFDLRDYNRYSFITLNERPVISVEKYEVKFPTSDEYMEWPIEWVKLTPSTGQIQLVPTGGTIATTLLGRGSQVLPLLAGQYQYLPQLFFVSYTPGIANDDIPINIIDAICKLAAVEVLTVAGDTIYKPGVNSISVSKDGVSESLGILNNGDLPAVFASRIGFYRMQLFGKSTPNNWDMISGDLGTIRHKYRGITMSVV